jgi:hypothetical protein
VWSETFYRYLLGQFTRDELKRRYLPAVAFIIAISIVIAWLLYPPALHYSIFADTISYLGDWSKNTTGWWGFAVAVWTIEVGFPPLYFYIHRRLISADKVRARLGTFCSLLGCACVFCIGIFDDVHEPILQSLTWSDVHLFFVFLGFSGLGLGCVEHGVTLGKTQFFLQKRARHEWFIPPWGLITAIGIGAGISLVVNAIDYGDAMWMAGGITSISFWEWMILLGFIGYAFWMVLILPENIQLVKSPSL